MRCSEQGLDQRNVWLSVNARHSGLSHFQHSRAHSEKFMVLPSSARNGLFMEYEIHFPQAFIWTVLYDMRRCSKWIKHYVLAEWWTDDPSRLSVYLPLLYICWAVSLKAKMTWEPRLSPFFFPHSRRGTGNYHRSEGKERGKDQLRHLQSSDKKRSDERGAGTQLNCRCSTAANAERLQESLYWLHSNTRQRGWESAYWIPPRGSQQDWGREREASRDWGRSPELDGAKNKAQIPIWKLFP